MIKHLVVFLLLIPMTMIGQDKKVDKIEMFYDQGNYKIVLRKINRLYKKEEYKNNPSLRCFEALSKFQIDRMNEEGSAQSVLIYEDFLRLDSTFYYQTVYSNYIFDLKQGLLDEIILLKEQGKEQKAKVKHETFKRLFENVVSFESITSVPKPIEDSNSDASDSSENVKPSSIRKKIIKEAEKHMGTKYVYGGTTPKGFDCSGYTSYVFHKNNIVLPRTAKAQAAKYEKIKKSKAKPGDLVFFGSSKSNISHVGIVVSNPGEPLTMIHASSSKGIMVSEIESNSYWSPRFQFVVKVIE